LPFPNPIEQSPTWLLATLRYKTTKPPKHVTGPQKLIQNATMLLEAYWEH